MRLILNEKVQRPFLIGNTPCYCHIFLLGEFSTVHSSTKGRQLEAPHGKLPWTLLHVLCPLVYFNLSSFHWAKSEL